MTDALPPMDADAARFVGSGLARPECVLAHSSGLLFAPDWTDPGGVSIIDADSGNVRRILATQPDAGVETPVRPNGIALEPSGAFLLTHMGAQRGAVYRLHPDGRCETVVDRTDRGLLPPANFTLRDSIGRLWITVSTTRTPRARDYRPDAASGFIALWADGAARVVADGLGYTNECLLSEDEKTLWVNETFARRLSAYDVVGDGLANKRTVATFGPGFFPDGLTPTADGALLITSIVSNRVARVDPDGSVETLLEDADPAHVDWVEAAFQAHEMGRPHLDQVKSRRLKNISNLALGGPTLRTAYLGCLLGDAIAALDLGVAGRPPPHWTYDLGPIAHLMEEAP